MKCHWLSTVNVYFSLTSQSGAATMAWRSNIRHETGHLGQRAVWVQQAQYTYTISSYTSVARPGHPVNLTALTDRAGGPCIGEPSPPHLAGEGEEKVLETITIIRAIHPARGMNT